VGDTEAAALQAEAFVAGLPFPSREVHNSRRLKSI